MNLRACSIIVAVIGLCTQGAGALANDPTECDLLRARVRLMEERAHALEQELTTLQARYAYKEQALQVFWEQQKRSEDREAQKAQLARKRAEFKVARLTLTTWRRYLDNPERPITKAELVRLIGRPDHVKKSTEAGGIRPESWIFFHRVTMEEGTPAPWHLVVNFTDDTVSQVAVSSPADLGRGAAGSGPHDITD